MVGKWDLARLRRGTAYAVAGMAVVAAIGMPASPGFAAPSTAGPQAPDKPTDLSTAPATSCDAATPTIVGDGQVTLYAPVSDPDGGVLGVAFALWATATPGAILVSSDPSSLTASSGTTAVLTIPVATLRTASGGAVTQFSWRVQVTDFTRTSDWSATCDFLFDPTRTEAPVVTPPVAATVGQPVTITVAPAATGPTPARYWYQLNAGPPGVVTATGGTAALTLVPRSPANNLTVTGLSPGSNVGASTTISFTAAPAPPAADGDLTGDGITDLVTVGGAHGLPAGLWLAAGDGTGQLPVDATNIGIHGTGSSSTSGPSDFDGAQILTGRFSGAGPQDVLVYFPTGERAGGGVLLRGNGDGSPVEAHANMWGGALSDINNLNPSQLVSASGGVYPDLIAVSGDDTVGYYLNYYDNPGGTLNYQFPAQLSTPTPTGGADWHTWTIATAHTPGGTAMFLWQRASGKLYLWDDLGFDVDTATFTYTQHALSDSWHTGHNLTLHGGDINGDGTGDLWTVADNAAATAWIVTGPCTITPQPSSMIKASLTSL
ncbi:hypothetical protein WEI85_01770 [Actinomycetes bacterium KLBMP 9797]